MLHVHQQGDTHDGLLHTANRVGDTVLWYENGKYSHSATFVMGNPNKY